MKIDRNNYEQWALDYIEGNLAGGARSRFEEFLSQHGDLAREVASLREDMPRLPMERIVYCGKQALLRGRNRLMPLRRAGSFLSGAVAASVLIGLFLLVDRTNSGDPQTLVSQNIPSAGENFAAEAVPAADAGACVAEAAAPVQAPVPIVSIKKAAPVLLPLVAEIRQDRVSQDKLAPVLVAGVGLAGPEMKPMDESQLAGVAVPEMQEVAPAAGALRNRGLLQADGPEMRNSLASILAPIDWIIPIKTYRTEDESGVVIASLIRIGNRNLKTK